MVKEAEQQKDADEAKKVFHHILLIHLLENDNTEKQCWQHDLPNQQTAQRLLKPNPSECLGLNQRSS